MRIGILRHQLFRTSEPFIVDQAGALTSSDVVYFGRLLDGVAPPGVKYRLFAEGSVIGLRYVGLGDGAELERACSDLQIEVLHSHFGVEGMCSLASARRLGIPSVTTLHGYDVTNTRRALLASKSPSWWRYAQSRRKFLESADRLVCVSDFVRTQACRLGASEDSCIVIPTGVDVGEIQASPVPDTPVVIHVGRLVEVKGTEYLIRAVALTAVHVPEIQLKIVGAGPLRKPLEDLVDTLGIRGNVTFLGALPRQQTLAEIASARVLCLPSVKASSGAVEGLGQVLLEAGALGRPVVGSDAGGIPEVVRDGVNGRLVGERDVAGLDEALRMILTDNTEASAMGRRGRSIVEAEYDLHRSALRLESLYSSMR